MSRPRKAKEPNNNDLRRVSDHGVRGRVSSKYALSDLDLTATKAAISRAREQITAELLHLHGFKWYKWAREFFESTAKVNLLTAGNQASKALDDSTEIPTTRGWKRLDELQIGDYVFGRDGRPTRIVDIPYVGEDEAFEFFFNDRSSVIASGHHKWICKGPDERFRKQYETKKRVWDNPTYQQWIVRTTNEIIKKSGLSPKPTRKFSFPVADAVQYGLVSPTGRLRNPYLLGLYLGNGSARGISLNALDTDIAEYMSQFGNVREYEGKVVAGVGGEYSWLCSLGANVLSYEKKIPDDYLLACEEDRRELLYGLMDTDGTVDQQGTDVNYSTTSEVLSRQVMELVTSLGGIAQISKYDAGYTKDGEHIKCRDVYVVAMWLPWCPFRSKRKAAKWVEHTRYRHERTLSKIVPIGKRRMRCITVDNADGSFLCTRNYLVTHNSSSLIRKNIEWACNKKLWPTLWPTEPRIFFYFYPTDAVATVEFEKKWVPEFLPKGSMKDHQWYGWRASYQKGYISALHFNSGVTIYFKTYSQKLSNLQTATVHMVSGDEEMPPHYVDELTARLANTEGYFNLVFTATEGHELWYRAMECIGADNESFKHARKWVVSLYDCQFYEDGTQGAWPLKKIKEREAMCTSEAEILRRVHGRFVRDEGRKFPTFSPERHVRLSAPLDPSWCIYGAVDIGSGKLHRSAGAVLFLAVNPEMTKGRVIRTWRGDNTETSAQDILDKYRELRGETPVQQACYDYGSAEFGIISARAGEGFIKADKKRDGGTQVVNILLQRDALTIDADVYDNHKLVTELMALPVGDKHKKYRDDLADCLRYVVQLVPWDYAAISPEEFKEFIQPDPYRSDVPDAKWTEKEYLQWQINQRRGLTGRKDADADGVASFEAEIEYWNDAYGS